MIGGAAFAQRAARIAVRPSPSIAAPRRRDYIYIGPRPVDIIRIAPEPEPRIWPRLHPRIDEIQRAVAFVFDVHVSEMASQRRARTVAWPRQVTMWLCRELTPMSYPQISLRFGGRDHSTIIHAGRKVESRLARDIELRAAVRAVLKCVAVTVEQRDWELRRQFG